MKIKFRVSTDELARLCKEMSDFLGSNKDTRKFKRFAINNQVREKGWFTFDLNVVDGYDHLKKKWTSGYTTEVELEAQTAFCWDCAKRNVEKAIDNSKQRREEVERGE